jgi:hypothetical protein
MDISAVVDVVKKCLENVPATRDSDHLLIAKIWHQHLGKEKIDKKKTMDFLVYFREGGLPNYASIIRSRRRLQVDHLELRGQNYEGNQQSTEKIKDQLKNFNI